MANSANERVASPFTNFNFSVEISVPGVSQALCSAAFAECDGLEMSIEVKTIREGGNNGAQIRLAGPVTYGQLTLKRGMTSSFELWDWFEKTMSDARLRADAEVVLLSEDKKERARFILSRCVPVKVRAPSLNAKDGAVAIEELQLAYESMKVKRPGGAGGGIGISAGVSVGASFSASASISAGASFEAGASLEAGASFNADASLGADSSANFSIG